MESWGLPLNPHLEQLLTAPYDDSSIVRKYVIAHGTVPFTGLTVPGEARELCNSGIGFGIMRASKEFAQQCLPFYFHARGYENIAIHGFVGQMFFRSNWYARLGFDQMWFQPDLIRAGLPNCRGALPGVCDGSIADWIGKSLLTDETDRPRFIYWVTLNSHLPEPRQPDLSDDGICGLEPELKDSPAMCSWFRLVRAVHRSVALAASRAAGRPTIFVLVGDHAPPFGDPRLRERFSGSDVPYLILNPVASAAE